MQQINLSVPSRNLASISVMGTPRPLGYSSLLFAFQWGAQGQADWYMGQPGHQASWRKVLDSQTFEPKNKTSIAAVALSPGGSYLAYALGIAGADGPSWHVRRVDDLQDLTDVLMEIHLGTLTWAPDEEGFYYARSPAPQDLNAKAAYGRTAIYHHRLGEPQDRDSQVFVHANPAFGATPHVASDGTLLVVFVGRGSDRRRGIYVKKLGEKPAPWRNILMDQSGDVRYVEALDGVITAISYIGAPNGRLVRFDSRLPIPLAEVVLEQDASKVMHHAVQTRSGFVVQYVFNGSSELVAFDPEGHEVGRIPLPHAAQVTGLNGSPAHHEVYFSLAHDVSPIIFSYTFTHGHSALRRLFPE